MTGPAQRMAMTVQALLVEDDAALRALLADYLIRYGIATTVAATAAELKRLLHPGAAAPFDVLLLDLMLPDGRGLALCRWVRQHHVPPILMLTAQGDPAGRVVGLEMGADDYLPKPFEPRRRVAHGWAVLLRSAAPTAALRVPFNGWTVDRLQRQRVSPMPVDRGRICLAHRDTGVACAPRCGGPALRNHPPSPMPSLTAHIPTTPEAPHDHDHGLGHDLQVMQAGGACCAGWSAPALGWAVCRCSAAVVAATAAAPATRQPSASRRTLSSVTG